MRYSSIGIFRKSNLSLLILFVLFSLTSLTGCVDEDQYADNPKGNFEALWNIIAQYAYFDMDDTIEAALEVARKEFKLIK